MIASTRNTLKVIILFIASLGIAVFLSSCAQLAKDKPRVSLFFRGGRVFERFYTASDSSVIAKLELPSSKCTLTKIDNAPVHYQDVILEFDPRGVDFLTFENTKQIFTKTSFPQKVKGLLNQIDLYGIEERINDPDLLSRIRELRRNRSLRPLVPSQEAYELNNDLADLGLCQQTKVKARFEKGVAYKAVFHSKVRVSDNFLSPPIPGLSRIEIVSFNSSEIVASGVFGLSSNGPLENGNSEFEGHSH